MQRLLAFAVGIQMFGEITDFLFLRVGSLGEGEGLEASGFVIANLRGQRPFTLFTPTRSSLAACLEQWVRSLGHRQSLYP